MKNLNGAYKKKPKASLLVVVSIFALIGVGLGFAAFADTPATTETPGGIWLSQSQINALPTSGAAWDALANNATGNWGSPDIQNQDNNNDVAVMGGALYYARTGDASIRTKVASNIMSAIGTEKGGRTLALGRNLIGYVIAADLINLRNYNADQDAQFRSWLTTVRTQTLDGNTLISTHNDRPNNWGTHAGASRMAADLFLGDMNDFAVAKKVFAGWLGDRSQYASFSYGDTSWQCDASQPVGINPVGCARDGHNLDGVLPDDQRRAGPYTWPPTKENYVYEALQGALSQAVILNHQGENSFGWSGNALLRAFNWLYNVDGFPAANDDQWEVHIVNHFYNAKFAASVPASPGKNVGWTDWTFGPGAGSGGSTPTPTPTPTPSDTTAPSAPTNLKSTSNAANASALSWTASTDNVKVTYYQVYRNGAKLDTTTTATSYTDTKAVAGQSYSYYVVAYDAAGNNSANSETINVTIRGTATTPDTTAPAVSITTPPVSSTPLSGTVSVTSSVSDASPSSGVNRVEYFVDGILETTVRTSPYKFNWDTSKLIDGSHKLQVTAYDNAGNKSSANISVMTKNATSGGTGSGTTLTFVASADARVNHDNADKNYGKENFLRARNSSSEWKSYVKFRVTGLSAKPQSVSLSLYANDGSPNSGDIYSASNSWSEYDIDWQNAPKKGAKLASAKKVESKQRVVYDLTKAVEGNGDYTFVIYSSDKNSVYFGSRESNNKPQLVIKR